ncbi:FAD-dependent oxidoreductase [Chelativorans sp. ZYF759]|uniref:NAD(P)/FAD-dependent oxidoreductase n=1 Tax=Chelativorans sp. ZYF759 TaxID=2692213 RepID=UPI00145E6493|nr:FAD-dependent oxidoreductase [Chelativorans sp. ZYF759]NMG41258.1 FAD-dependent oxidoreductase [Chelativorans sp. ZYF759]
MKIAIVGAGIAGLSTAWSLTARGHDVTLVEQGTIPNPLAASGDHHRIIRRAYGPDSGYGRLITEAYEAWDALWADLGTNHYDHRGFICMSREEGDEAERYLEGMRAGGYAHEVFGAEEAAERWPFLDAVSMRFVFHSPEGGALHCRRIAAGTAAWLRRNGATVLENTRVISVDPKQGRLQLESGDTILADRVVVTAGAWVPKLFPEVTGTLSTHRTGVVYLQPPAELVSAWDSAPIILDVGGETDGYIIPPSGGAGLKFGSGLTKRPTDDADADRVPRPGEGEALRDLFAGAIARVGDYAVREFVTCAYTFTADERFHCQEIGVCLVVSACSGHGYKFGAAVGRRVAEALETGDSASLGSWLRAEAV